MLPGQIATGAELTEEREDRDGESVERDQCALRNMSNDYVA